MILVGDTRLVIVKDQCFFLVYPIISIKQQACENLGSNCSSKLRENDEEKTILLDEFVCLQIGIKDF